MPHGQKGEENIIQRLYCDPRWSVCLLDFTYKNKISDYFVFRVARESWNIVENYFGEE